MERCRLEMESCGVEAALLLHRERFSVYVSGMPE